MTAKTNTTGALCPICHKFGVDKAGTCGYCGTDKDAMPKITTVKHGNGDLENFEITIDDKYFGTWYGHDENDAIAFAKRNFRVRT